MTNGYKFYFKDGSNVLTFPITPGKLSMKIGGKNKVVSLINEGDINILKSPGLAEIEFEAIFPLKKYPYGSEPLDWQKYYDFFKGLKTNKKSFRFIVARTTPKGKRTWDTNELVALESFDIDENADYGDDIHVKFNLKQYREYGVKTVKVKSVKPKTTSTASQKRSDDNRAENQKQYTVKSGDCLWNIAKMFYGDGSKYMAIYNANREVIENAAKQHGFQSSSTGNRIWAGTVLIIPNAKYSERPQNNYRPKSTKKMPQVGKPSTGWKPSSYNKTGRYNSRNYRNKYGYTYGTTVDDKGFSGSGGSF